MVAALRICTILLAASCCRQAWADEPQPEAPQPEAPQVEAPKPEAPRAVRQLNDDEQPKARSGRWSHLQERFPAQPSKDEQPKARARWWWRLFSRIPPPPKVIALTVDQGRRRLLFEAVDRKGITARDVTGPGPPRVLSTFAAR